MLSLHLAVCVLLLSLLTQQRMIAQIERGELGSPASEMLLHKLKPRFWSVAEYLDDCVVCFVREECNLWAYGT